MCDIKRLRQEPYCELQRVSTNYHEPSQSLHLETKIELNLNDFRLTNELLFHTRTMFLNLKSIVYHTQGPSNELKDLL